MSGTPGKCQVIIYALYGFTFHRIYWFDLIFCLQHEKEIVEKYDIVIKGFNT